jgi:hypothetical protein
MVLQRRQSFAGPVTTKPIKRPFIAVLIIALKAASAASFIAGQLCYVSSWAGHERTCRPY